MVGSPLSRFALKVTLNALGYSLFSSMQTSFCMAAMKLLAVSNPL